MAFPFFLDCVMSFNPYRYLANVLRAQLRLESAMDPKDVVSTTWMTVVEFADTRVTIGRGGANTCFFTFGDGKRRVDYPVKLLAILERYSRQDYPIYRVIGPDHKLVRQFFSKAHALDWEVQKGWSLFGVDAAGEEHDVATARKSVRGDMVWIMAGRRQME